VSKGAISGGGVNRREETGRKRKARQCRMSACNYHRRKRVLKVEKAEKVFFPDVLLLKVGGALEKKGDLFTGGGPDKGLTQKDKGRGKRKRNARRGLSYRCKKVRGLIRPRI